MQTFEASSLITATRESVWNLLTAVTAWPRWLPTVTSVDALDGPSLVKGARFKIVQPKLRPATWVVTVVEPMQRFVWESRSPGLRVVADHRIAESSPGTSRVVLSISFRGALGGIVGLLARSITQRYLAQEAAAIKREIENGE